MSSAVFVWIYNLRLKCHQSSGWVDLTTRRIDLKYYSICPKYRVEFNSIAFIHSCSDASFTPFFCCWCRTNVCDSEQDGRSAPHRTVNSLVLVVTPGPSEVKRAQVRATGLVLAIFETFRLSSFIHSFIHPKGFFSAGMCWESPRYSSTRGRGWGKDWWALKPEDLISMILLEQKKQKLSSL